jgi:UDP-N-acetylmuramoyl-tripeptide--D-alanyl-D-alanine ligase
MSPLWTSEDAQAASGGVLHGGTWRASGISIDSRTVSPGDLFVALVGPSHDGHDHIAAALQSGAVAAVAHRRPADLSADAPLLMVADTLAGLNDLGRAARKRSTAKSLGITGSVGKTGTKEMLKLALGNDRAHASVGSFNNHWGVPLSLARLPSESAFGVFELGMNHAGEITPLSQMVQPEIAIITAVEAVHLEFFDSVEGIAEAKAEIFRGVVAGGTAILPRDNPYYPLLRRRAEGNDIEDIRSFGNHLDADARLLDCAVEADHTLVFALINNRAVHYRIGVAGRTWAMNSLAVLLAAEAAGVPLEAAMAALAHLSPPKGRGVRQNLAWGDGAITLIDESYNASPVSVRAALATLGGVAPVGRGRRIAVLGDMRELGASAAELHRGLTDAITSNNIDLLFAAGPLMGELFDSLDGAHRGGHGADVDALAPLVSAALQAGDVVMVKGSAGSRMGRIVTLLQDMAVPKAAIVNGHQGE